MRQNGTGEMSDNEGRVVEQTESTLVKSKVSEIDFGYHDSYIVYPGCLPI